MRHTARLAGRVVVIACLAGSGLWASAGQPAPKPQDAAAARVLAAARRQLGDRYSYGGNGPDRWDCSGLTSVLWTTVGGVKGMPRRSVDQQAWAWPVSAAEARPGDLVFFGNPVHHVSIYLGDGRILDASSSRGAVVERAVWTSDVVRYGRVPRPGVPRPGGPAPKTQPAPKPKPKQTVPPRRPAPPAPAAPALRAVPKPGHRPASAPPKQVELFVKFAVSQNNHAWRARSSGPSFDAAGLVRWSWWRAGLGVLPDSPAGIERHATSIRLADLRVGDLVLYGKPAVHVGIYVGNGRMIDASKVLRKVVVRDVFASETVRYARLRRTK